MEELRQRHRMVAALEKIAESLGKMADESVVEFEAGPPICPHCGAYDPRIRTVEQESEGQLSEFIVQAVCLECEHTLYAVIDSFSMHQGLDTVRKEIESRAGNDRKDI